MPQSAAAAPWSRQVVAQDGIWEARVDTLEEEAAARPAKVAKVMVLSSILRDVEVVVRCELVV